MGKIGKEQLRALKFLLFSISAGVIDALTYTLCFELFGMAEWISTAIAVVMSVLWNFTLNRRFTFQSANNVPIAMLKVAAFYVIFIPLSSYLTYCWTELRGFNSYIIKAITMVANLVLEFFYQKYYVFRDSIDTNDLAKKQ